MLTAISNYMLLPNELSDFEQTYLSRMNKVAVGFFLTHLPVFTLIAFFNDTDPILAAVLTSLVLAGPILAIKTWQSKRAVSVVMGITAMFMGGLLVHFGQGPVQIEMHFYFFVLLALLAVFANPMVIVAAAVTAALHHALLWVLIPQSVFNYDAPFWVVAVHAAFVVLESAAACFIARSFFDNVIELEKKVMERTAEVNKRNEDMRRILNSVEQGFFTIDHEGRISDERSAAVETLLGPISESETFIDVLRRHDDHAAEWYELGLEDVFADIMPIEVTLGQLPSRILSGENHIAISSQAIFEDATLTGLAIVLTDITAEVQREKLEASSREMVAIVEHAAKDKSGLASFYGECVELVQALQERESCDIVLTKRRVHTLKGNTAIFGLNRVSEACHSIEDFIAENNELPERSAWDAVSEAWENASKNIVKVIGQPNGTLEVASEEVADVFEGLLGERPREELAIQLASWQLEPTKVALTRVSDQIHALADRLGKGEVHIEINDNDLRLDPEDWSEFWSSFVHIVRNAVDHGLETPEEREEFGKSKTATVSIDTSLVGRQFHISISDDGRGINWDRISESAYEKGIPAETNADLIEALFADGVSTAEFVTDTSGRGVGMAAVKQACEQRGGNIAIDTELRKGTTFTFKFPIESMASTTLKMLNQKEVKNPERALQPLELV